LSMKVSVAGVHDALWRLYGEEALPFNGKIKLATAVFHAALREIKPASAEYAIIVCGDVQLGNRLPRSVGQQRIEDAVLRPITVRAGVGQVVGHKIKRLALRHQTGTGCVESTVHRGSPQAKEQVDNQSRERASVGYVVDIGQALAGR